MTKYITIPQEEYEHKLSERGIKELEEKVERLQKENDEMQEALNSEFYICYGGYSEYFIPYVSYSGFKDKEMKEEFERLNNIIEQKDREINKKQGKIKELQSKENKDIIGIIIFCISISVILFFVGILIGASN